MGCLLLQLLLRVEIVLPTPGPNSSTGTHPSTQYWRPLGDRGDVVQWQTLSLGHSLMTFKAQYRNVADCYPNLPG